MLHVLDVAYLLILRLLSSDLWPFLACSGRFQTALPHCLFSLSIYLTDCLFVCPPVYLSVPLSICLSICLFICPSVYFLSVCLSVWLSIWLSVCLSVCLRSVNLHVSLTQISSSVLFPKNAYIFTITVIFWCNKAGKPCFHSENG